MSDHLTPFQDSFTLLETDSFRAEYVLQADQLLLHFDGDASADEIDRFLDANGLRPIERSQPPSEAFEFLRDANYRLRAAQMLWVIDTDESRGTLDRATSLAQHPVIMVSPVYFAVGRGYESAASPLFDQLEVELDDAAEIEREDLLSQILGSDDTQRIDPAIDDEPLRLGPFLVLRHTKGRDDPVAARTERARIAGIDGVRSAEFGWMPLAPFHSNSVQTLSSGSVVASQHQKNLVRINAPITWSGPLGDPAVSIAVIDDSFDTGHEDLNFLLASQLNVAALLGGVGDAQQVTTLCYSGHGTHVSGVAAADGGNNLGISGVAGACTILPIQAFYEKNLPGPPLSTQAAVGIAWAVQQGARVINMSFGCPATPLLWWAVRHAEEHDVVLCAAAGNANYPEVNFPARFPMVLAVGALDNAERRRFVPGSVTGSSQYGAGLDVMAPCDECWTTDPTGTLYLPGDSSYFTWSGATSAASPHVAGLAAVIRAVNSDLRAAQVRAIIRSTCDWVNPGIYKKEEQAWILGRNAGWNREIGFGIIDCKAALDLAGAVDPAGYPGEPEPNLEPVDPIVVDDPTQKLCGYLAPSSRSNHIRLYCSLDLRAWYDIPTAAIVHVESISADLAQPAPGYVMVHVRADAGVFFQERRA